MKLTQFAKARRFPAHLLGSFHDTRVRKWFEWGFNIYIIYIHSCASGLYIVGVMLVAVQVGWKVCDDSLISGKVVSERRGVLGVNWRG
jgi:hypothetical protein